MARTGHSFALDGMRRGPVDGISQRENISSADKPARLHIDADFARAIAVIGDGEDVREQGLRDGAGKALAITGMGEDIKRAKQGGDARRRDEAGQDDLGI